MDEPIINPIPVEPGKKRDRMMKILVPIFTIIFLVVLIIVKTQSPNFPLGYVILIGSIIIIIGAILFFSFNIAQSFSKLKDLDKDKNKLPEPAEIGVLWQKAMIALTNNIYRDHIKEYIQTINHSVGKNTKSLVVEFQVKSLYRPRLKCCILINANYPNRLPTVLFEPGNYQLKAAIQSMSFDPEDPANTEETTVHNELTGTTATTKRKTYHKKNTSLTQAKKEELI